MIKTIYESYKRVSEQYEEQAAKKQTYDATVDQYVANSLTYFNAQVMEDVVRQKSTSIGSDDSRISTSTSRLREAKLAVTKASLIEQQTASKNKRALQLELVKIDMEIKRKELEYKQRYELAQIEMENEVVDAQEKIVLAELEAEIAEQTVLELMKHKDKDKESNQTRSSSTTSPFIHKERSSTRPVKVDHISFTEQPNLARKTSLLRENPKFTSVSKILHEHDQQAQQFPKGFPSATKFHRQSASPTRTINTNDPTERYQNSDNVSYSQPVGSTPFAQRPLLSSLSRQSKKLVFPMIFPRSK